MFTFLNLTKVASWVAMLYTLLTASTYFLPAIIFYYIAVAVLALCSVCIVYGSSEIVCKQTASLKAIHEASSILYAVSKVSVPAIVIPNCIAIVLLLLLGQNMLACSQFVIAVAALWSREQSIQAIH